MREYEIHLCPGGVTVTRTEGGEREIIAIALPSIDAAMRRLGKELDWKVIPPGRIIAIQEAS